MHDDLNSTAPYDENVLHLAGKSFDANMHVLYVIEKNKGQACGRRLAKMLNISYATLNRRVAALRANYGLKLDTIRLTGSGRVGAEFTYEVTNWSFINRADLMRFFDEQVYAEVDFDKVQQGHISDVSDFHSKDDARSATNIEPQG